MKNLSFHLFQTRMKISKSNNLLLKNGNEISFAKSSNLKHSSNPTKLICTSNLTRKPK